MKTVLIVFTFHMSFYLLTLAHVLSFSHCIFLTYFLLYKSNNTICIFYWIFADEWDNPNIHVILRETIGSTPDDKPRHPEVYWQSGFFSESVIEFIREIILLPST